MKFSVKTALFLLFSLGLLAFALRNIQWSDIRGQFAQARYGWLLPLALSIVATFGLRAARWRLALQALGYRPSLFHATVAVSAGNLASLIIPGAGELTRCGTLQRTDGIPLAQGVGSVVAERLVDVGMLLVLLVLTLTLEYQRLFTVFSDLLTARFQAMPGWLWPVMTGLILLASGLIIWWLIRPASAANAVPGLWQRFGEGLLGLRRLPHPAWYVALSILIYFVSFLTMYFAGLATPQFLSNPRIGLSLLTIGSVGGLAVPTQGGVGTYHVLFALVLGLYGFGHAPALAMATFIHAVVMGLSLIVSGLSFLLIPFLLNRREQKTAPVL